MSKFNYNLVKAKIESIAKNPNNIRKSKENNLNISTKTLKDSFSYLEELKETSNKESNIKKAETNYVKNIPKLNLHKNINNSSLCTKDNSSNINGMNESYKEEKRILYDKIIKEINIEEINELKEIYDDLLLLFNDIKIDDLLSNKSKILDNINKLQIVAYHYMKILLNENFKKVIKFFYDSIEINKFFLYQIYLILNIIYLNQEKLNEYLLLSYKTILLYSIQNYEIVSSILYNISLFGDNKIHNNIFKLNKIIVSLLKTLTNVPSNNQIMYYISPIKNSYNNENTKENIDTKESGLNKLINLLINNKDLTEKMNTIEKEEFKIIKNIEESNQKILPEFDQKKFKFSVFIELDETLVHYCEVGESYFVKVRLGSENFLEYIKTFCEIIIVTTSSKEYSDIIIDNLNKKGDVIKHILYVEDNYYLDLSKINRDMNKCIFISHEPNFMKEPKENSIILKGFYGDENDKEFTKLEKEFKKIEKEDIKDIRIIIKDINNNINKEKK